VVTEATVSSSNNEWHACFFFGAVFVGFPNPLTGHGGWGRACGASVTCGPIGGQGVAASVCVHSACWRLSVHSLSASLLLACLGGEGKQEWMGVREASPLFFYKRDLPCIVFPKVSRPHLVIRGGEEVGKSGLSADWSRVSPRHELLEIQISAALPPHRRLPAGAIRGHWDGHAVLDAAICASSFLYARIFCRSGATSKPLAVGL
jgi:hypothetical protein